MRALKATAPAPSSGGFGNAPAPYIGPGPSPLVQSYNEWGGGHAYGTNSALPRDWATFLSGMFGPLAPIQPVPIDIPEEGGPRPEPRRMQYPVGWDMPMGMPGTEGWGKLANFETLRTLADLYSVARAAIELRKNELRGIGWGIAPTSEASKAMRGDHKAARDFGERRARAVRFFRRPDPNYADFSSWFEAILEEMFVTDALSIYVHPSRVEGKGLLGSSIAALDLIDGSLIKPLVDIRGGSPAPPNPAFQSFLYGVPRVDLATLILEEDGTDPDDLVAEYRGDQLMYLPLSPRTWTVYGQAPIERGLIPIMTGLNKQNYQQQFYSEGSVPAVYISPGDTAMTPSQLRELQDALNSLAGDTAWKHKIIVLPGGSKIDPQKPNTLADDLDTLVQIETCMAFDVQPFELGVIPQLSAAAAASSGAARQTVTAHVELRQRKSTIPMLLFLKNAIFDRVIQDVCGMWDMEWQWEGLQEEGTEDEVSQIVEEIGSGLLSIDEGRQMLGLDPWDLPITSDPGWATQWGGFVPLTGISQATAQPLGGSPGPGGPGQGTPQGQQQQKPKAQAAVNLGGPSSATRPGGPSVPATVPRNRLSTGQRRGQAQQVTAAQNKPGSVSTPAHSGARSAALSSTPQQPKSAARTRKTVEEMLTATVLESSDTLADTPPAGMPDTAKAVRELGLLRSYLHRGEPVSAWQPRHIPPRLLSQIAENMAKGMNAGQACDVAKTTLTAAGSGGPAERHVTCGQGHRHWGAYGAAGLLIRAKGRDGKLRYLLQRRGGSSDHPGTWGVPGGALHEGELPAMGAIREATEEMGVLPNIRPGHIVADDHGGWVFHTVVCDAPTEFRPTVDGATSHETAGWAWVTARETRELPLHPGFAGNFDQVRRARSSKPVAPVAKDAADPHDPSPVEAEHVRSVMLRDFPASALGWVDQTRWVGPVEIPHDRINYADEGSWAASKDKKRVKRFARAYRDGEDVHPVIMVQTPGSTKVTMVDGRHRALGSFKAGQNALRAYLGFTGSDRGPWDETHSSQYTSKSAAGYQLNPRSGMISLDLEPGTIPAVPGGVDDHHVTIVYLGPDVNDYDFAEACRRVQEAARALPGAAVGTIEGIGTFPASGSSDGKIPVYAHAEIPAALDLRGALEDLSASEHKDFRPHVTLAYLDDGDLMPDPVPRTPIMITTVSVHRGDDLFECPLGPGLGFEKSAETPHLEATPDLLGPEGLWHTPDRHVGGKQKLPNYIEHIAHALMRDQGLGESEAIAYAINAVKRWAKGDLDWGGKHITPEVIAASQRALQEWDELKASHHP